MGQVPTIAVITKIAAAVMASILQIPIILPWRKSRLKKPARKILISLSIFPMLVFMFLYYYLLISLS